MASIRSILAVTSVIIGAVPAIVFAQDTTNRTVEQYTCKDVMRESGSNRDTSIAFLHGYLLGKSGGSEFNIEALTKQTDAFIDRCLDNPNEKAKDVMLEVKK
jgi:hypothetical protein